MLKSFPKSHKNRNTYLHYITITHTKDQSQTNLTITTKIKKYWQTIIFFSIQFEEAKRLCILHLSRIILEVRMLMFNLKNNYY